MAGSRRIPARNAETESPKRKPHVVHFSSQTSEWPTPQWLFDELNEEFNFTLDPCSTDENAKCSHHFTRQDNGLLKNWRREIVFMNPLYGREIGAWMGKAFDAAQNGATVVCLVPSRTDTQWWHTHAMRGEVRFLRGRLKFGNSSNSAPFPSALVIFRAGPGRPAGPFSSFARRDHIRTA